jgi:Spy/CpxP family protein refolding chaperone
MTMAMFAAVVLSASLAYAQPAEHNGPRAKEWKEKMEAKKQEMFKDLNLTDEQKKELEENKKKNREMKRASFQAIKDKMITMRKELENPELNMDKINQIQGEIKIIQAQTIDARLQSVLEIRKILTLEQFSKFLTHVEESKARGQHKREGQHESQGSEGSQDAPEPQEPEDAQ